MKLAIVFTFKNLPELTRAAYESIRCSHPYKVVFIDDYSNEETKAWLAQVEAADPNVILVTDPVTASLAAKWNIGCAVAETLGCDAALICNNDIVFHPATIDALVAVQESTKAAMVTAHNVRDQIPSPAELSTIEVPNPGTTAPHPDFSCFLLMLEAWHQVGNFDQAFTPCYFEDNDYHYRMKKLGLQALTTTAAPYYHYGSKTQNSVPGGLCRSDQFDRNRQYFIRKHGVDPATYEPLI